MSNGWGPLAGVCAVVLFLTGTSSWPRHDSLSFTAKAIADPVTAIYDDFNPAYARLKQVQVVFRHGARTPLNTIYQFPGSNWIHCKDHYQGVEVELHDENGGTQPPTILDPDNPALPGGCRQGTLTEAGYGMATDLGSQLRKRYVAGGSGPTAGFLPDLNSRQGSLAGVAAVAAAATGDSGSGRGGVLDPAVARLRTTPIRRTIATLRGVLSGLWPRLADATAAGAGVVLPVGASEEVLEIMYGNNRTCGRLGPLFEAMERDLEAADARNAELPRLNHQVAEALELDPQKKIMWPKLYDTLAALIADGAPLPPGATPDILEIIWAEAERHEAAVIGPGTDLCASLGPGGDGGTAADSSSGRRRRCHEVLRLSIGMLVQRLLDNMENGVAEAEAAVAVPSRRHLRAAAAHGYDALAEMAADLETAPPSKLYLYSGHDSSVTPLLAILGQPAKEWPPFTANLIFELWQGGQTPAGAAAARRRAAAEAVGRRGLGLGGAAGSGSDSGSGSGSRVVAGSVAGAASGGGGDGDGQGGLSSEFWVRILYNGEPLVVPSVSNSGGWAPLRLLRQRVLMPYAIRPSEHTATCARLDTSDLDTPQAPAATAAAGSRLREDWLERERALRHALL